MPCLPSRYTHVPSPTSLNHVIQAGWLALAAGLPLVFSPWLRNSFELPKVLWLWSVVAIMGAAWLIRGLRREEPASSPNIRTPLRILHLAALVFSGILIITTLFSANPLASTQGSYDRMQGLISWLCYLALFLLVASELRELAQVKRLLTAIVWGSAPVVVYALLQLAGLDPLTGDVEGSPVSSSLGRSNFVASYLVLVIPFTLVCIWQTTQSQRRIAYAVLLAAQMICLAATTSRAAVFGLLAMGGMLVLALIWQHGHRRLAYIGLAVGAVTVFLLPLILILLPDLPGSIGARAAIWRSTLPLIADRPMAGYGLETYGQVFTTIFPPELIYLQGRAVYVDRAHNLVLDTLTSLGSVGLAAYVALIVAALTIAARSFLRLRDRKQRFILLAGAAAVIGHLAEMQFSFEVTTTNVLLWMIFGLLVSPWVNRTSALARYLPGYKTSITQTSLAVMLLATVISASALLFTADAFAGDAKRVDTSAELTHSLAAMQHATRLWPTQSAYRLHLSWLYVQRAGQSVDAFGDLQAAQAELDAARQLASDDYRVWAAYGELYAAWSKAGDTERFVQAEEAYRRAVALFPNNAMLHTGWGLVYADQQRWAEAADQFHQATALDNTDAWAFSYLGDVLSAQRDALGAERAYLQAVRWAPQLSRAYRGLGRIYLDRGEIEMALLAYEQALELAPNEPDRYLDLAIAQRAANQALAACASARHGAIIAPQHRALQIVLAECRAQ